MSHAISSVVGSKVGAKNASSGVGDEVLPPRSKDIASIRSAHVRFAFVATTPVAAALAWLVPMLASLP